LNVCVFVEYIIVVSDFPSKLRFVSVGQDLEEIEPAHLGLKTDDILDLLLVVWTKEHGWVVLVLHEELHRGFNHNSRRNYVGSVVWIQVVKEVALVILGNVNCLRCTHDGVLRDLVLGSGLVGTTLKWDTVGNFNFEELNFWLFNSEIRHLNIKAVELNAANTFFHIVWEFTFTDLVKPEVVRKSTCLVELTEKFVYFIMSVVKDKLVPETPSAILVAECS
jgi:hypothetical protein